MGRKITFYNGGYFHVYNRGVDKRVTFTNFPDYLRFLDGMTFFNQENPIGSLYEYSFTLKDSTHAPGKPLVRIIAYNLLDNHFHLLLEQLEEGGVSKFIQKLIGGYTKYFNEKYLRSGPLFSSPFKASHISTDSYLKKVEAYVHLNHIVHGLGTQGSKSSLDELIRGRALNKQTICQNSELVGTYGSVGEYENYAKELLKDPIHSHQSEKNQRQKSEYVKMLLE